jgi:hypothetical protein
MADFDGKLLRALRTMLIKIRSIIHLLFPQEWDSQFVSNRTYVCVGTQPGTFTSEEP